MRKSITVKCSFLSGEEFWGELGSELAVEILAVFKLMENSTFLKGGTL